jgi:outer membrane protein OmpA-like peptidoglycan-associated protein
MRRLAFTLLAALVFALAMTTTAPAAERADPDRDRLAAVLATLDGDPALADLAPLERLKARQALAQLQQAKSRQREQAIAVTSRWVDAAVAAANAELLERQARQLDDERDQIMIEANRLAAARARREADILRLQTLAREEEAERLAETGRIASEESAAQLEAATAEAEQARRLAAARQREVELARKEAELAASIAQGSPSSTATAAPGKVPASRKVNGRTVYTLDGDAYPSGSAQLTARALASLKALVASQPAGKTYVIDAYTDSQGEDAANKALSQRRADAVRRALAAAGVPAADLDATGHGEASPVADNATEAGRARNRRVEITVL